jgi:hypothetical protein
MHKGEHGLCGESYRGSRKTLTLGRFIEHPLFDASVNKPNVHRSQRRGDHDPGRARRGRRRG